jgi:protoheme IX farnesyltransferase
VQVAAQWTGPAWWVYKYSLLYLALLFVAMAVDRRIAG